ncbi:hypothetical protein F4824DRAFT_481413 [Ustulina deusta]|nr:hypothetical protein F4824DRAFT_481413 [Ustulina deusta]
MPCCMRCDRQFQSDGALHQHLRMSSFHHYCTPCQKDFGSPRARQQHVLNSPRHHVCSDCSPGREFATQGSLEKYRVDAYNFCIKC